MSTASNTKNESVNYQFKRKINKSYRGQSRKYYKNASNQNKHFLNKKDNKNISAKIG